VLLIGCHYAPQKRVLTPEEKAWRKRRREEWSRQHHEEEERNEGLQWLPDHLKPYNRENWVKKWQGETDAQHRARSESTFETWPTSQRYPCYQDIPNPDWLKEETVKNPGDVIRENLEAWERRERKEHLKKTARVLSAEGHFPAASTLLKHHRILESYPESRLTY
jgi:hypothetical protein